MNKSFYNFTIFFLSLLLAAGCLQSLIYIWRGPQIFYMEPFLPWFITLNLIHIIASFLTIRYYYYKQFWFTFSIAIIAIVTNLSLSVIFSVILLKRELAGYYIPALIFFLGASILYGISLLFSNARKKPWLKAAGLFTLIIGLVLVSTWLWGIFFPEVQKSGITEKINQWASFVSGLGPVLFIMHFRSELRMLKEANTETNRGEFSENILPVMAWITSVVALVFGTMIVSECYSSMYWGEKNFENTKKLARLFETRTLVGHNGDTLWYHLLKPLNYDAKKKYPLVVCLPYGGQPGTDKMRQMEGAAAAEVLSTDGNRKKYPAFLFIPNCPPGSGWGGIPNYPSVDALVYEAIDALDAEPGIDVKRRYVTGISRGGYGSWHFICTRPDMFAAAIPVCGGEDPKLASKIVHVAVWAFHGAEDRNVPVSGSRDMIRAMKKAGGNPRYTEYPNEGHNIWNEVSNTPGLWDWLFARNGANARDKNQETRQVFFFLNFLITNIYI